MKATRVLVGDTAVQLVPKDDLYRTVYLQIEANRTVYIGPASVTSDTGFPVVKHSAPTEVVLWAGDDLWAVCATGETDYVRVLTPPQDV